jgi:hypothetical protein
MLRPSLPRRPYLKCGSLLSLFRSSPRRLQGILGPACGTKTSGLTLACYEERQPRLPLFLHSRPFTHHSLLELFLMVTARKFRKGNPL